MSDMQDMASPDLQNCNPRITRGATIHDIIFGFVHFSAEDTR